MDRTRTVDRLDKAGTTNELQQVGLFLKEMSRRVGASNLLL